MSKSSFSPTGMAVYTILSILACAFLIQEYLEQHNSLFLYCLTLGFIISAVFIKYEEYFDYIESLDQYAQSYYDRLKVSQLHSGASPHTLATFFADEDTPRILHAFIDDSENWELEFIKQGYLGYIRPYKQEQVIQLLYRIHMSDKSEEKKKENDKRLVCLSVSALVFNFKVPADIQSPVKATMDCLFKYLAYTHPVSKEHLIRQALIKYPPDSSPVRTKEQRLHHEHLVKCIAHAFVYIEHSNTNLNYRSKNFYLVRELIRINATKNTSGPSFELNQLTEEDLRKVFTMAYLSIGMHVPMDYISMDDFVLDFINKTEKYHKFTQPAFSLVTPTKQEVDHV
jgi:hypothetical protein